ARMRQRYWIHVGGRFPETRFSRCIASWCHERSSHRRNSPDHSPRKWDSVLRNWTCPRPFPGRGGCYPRWGRPGGELRLRFVPKCESKLPGLDLYVHPVSREVDSTLSL